MKGIENIQLSTQCNSY